MTRSQHWGPVPDGARDGRRVEGGTRHLNAECGEEGEFNFEDREWHQGYVTGGVGQVDLTLDGTMDMGEEAPTPVRVTHDLSPEVARQVAYGLLLFATIAERRAAG